MNISVEFEYHQCNHPVLVQISVIDQTHTLDLQSGQKTISIDFDLDNPTVNQNVTMIIGCKNPAIVQTPLTVTRVLLDNFYHRDQFSYRGRPKFSLEFLKEAQCRGQYLDTTVTDSNRLDFMGELHVVFAWPFWRNMRDH